MEFIIAQCQMRMDKYGLWTLDSTALTLMVKNLIVSVVILSLVTISVPPVIVSIQTLDYSALTCASSGSPVTELTWYKDGVRYYGPEEDGTPLFSLEDRVDASYTSVVNLPKDPNDLVGTYECSAENMFGVSRLNFRFEGFSLSYH